MANFSEIPGLSDFQLMDMFRKSDETTIAIALLGAPEEIRKRIVTVLPENAARRINKRMKELNKMSERELIIESQRAILSAILNAPRASGQVSGPIKGT